MRKLIGIVALAVACVACGVDSADAARRVTILRRQRIVQQGPQTVVVQRPLQLVAPPVLVPRQTLFFGIP